MSAEPDKAQAGPELADVARYAAMREDIERRLVEAQREINAHTRETSDKIRAHWYGRAAALGVLLQDDNARRKAPHNGIAQRPADENQSKTTP